MRMHTIVIEWPLAAHMRMHADRVQVSLFGCVHIYMHHSLPVPLSHSNLYLTHLLDHLGDHQSELMDPCFIERLGTKDQQSPFFPTWLRRHCARALKRSAPFVANILCPQSHRHSPYWDVKSRIPFLRVCVRVLPDSCCHSLLTWRFLCDSTHDLIKKEHLAVALCELSQVMVTGLRFSRDRNSAPSIAHVFKQAADHAIKYDPANIPFTSTTESRLAVQDLTRFNRDYVLDVHKAML
ncbi:hypothetical protein B0F90DRAFT_1242280 [Multifurca ochricompacta]|uniref:Uncharacterized protein n=1 Tax=Multifurca ochricompacta TaxID=376703 RepID=A0AAD4M6U8_9AGAM|nr:hypothetical protein B0F90DRAFT_1242280 [Multifurca ochricompacta]